MHRFMDLYGFMMIYGWPVAFCIMIYFHLTCAAHRGAKAIIWKLFRAIFVARRPFPGVSMGIFDPKKPEKFADQSSHLLLQNP